MVTDLAAQAVLAIAVLAVNELVPLNRPDEIAGRHRGFG
jgi:hypothetical protein